MVKFDFEVIDVEKDKRYTFKNCDSEIINAFTTEEGLDKIFNVHYFEYAMYDRLDLMGIPFIVMKSTKKNVVMVKMEF